MKRMDSTRTANLLGALSIALGDRILEAAEDERQPPTDAAALVVVGFSEGIAIETLARILALSHSGTVRLVDRLAGQGLVARGRGTDGRAVALSLTAEGEHRRDDILAARAAAVADVLAPLDTGERAALVRMLEKMLGRLGGDAIAADRVCRFCDERTCPQERCPVTLSAEDGAGRRT
jgi:DNA-binding MarR family transcriptional regulator